MESCLLYWKFTILNVSLIQKHPPNWYLKLTIRMVCFCGFFFFSSNWFLLAFIKIPIGDGSGGQNHSQMVKEDVYTSVGTLQSVSQSWAVPCVCLTSELRMLFPFWKRCTKRRGRRRKKKKGGGGREGEGEEKEKQRPYVACKPKVYPMWLLLLQEVGWPCSHVISLYQLTCFI